MCSSQKIKNANSCTLQQDGRTINQIKCIIFLCPLIYENVDRDEHINSCKMSISRGCYARHKKNPFKLQVQCIY